MSFEFSDVAKALDDALEMEEGTRLERVCIALAKRKYPGLIATETKKDGGEDAVFVPRLGDEERLAVAVSMTNELSKVMADAATIAKHAIEIERLIFYTPRKVSNTRARDWAKEIKDKFGHDLHVVSREDIIHSLITPENEFICQRVLGLSGEPSNDLSQIYSRATHAAKTVSAQWLQNSECDTDELIRLSVVPKGDERDQPENWIEFTQACKSLIDGDRVVLFGGAGAGKSTTLAMLGSWFCDSEEMDVVPVIVSLPEWIDSGSPLLQFVATHPAFVSQKVSDTDLALLAQRGQLVVLVNGWNEVGANEVEKARRSVSQLQRDYPVCGIFVTSRPHSLDPIGAGAIYYELLELSNAQRRGYVVGRLGEGAGDFLTTVETSIALDSLSRTPLILGYLVTLHESGKHLPETKSGVLTEVVSHMEALDEHRAALVALPLLGFSRSYLEELGYRMMQSRRTSLKIAAARSVIREVAERLSLEGQLTQDIDPSTVIDVLCSHHILERVSYPEEAVRFGHQQFQELFAAKKLAARMSEIMEDSGDENIETFKKEILNLPIWEEPLLLLAESCGTVADQHSVSIASKLVEWSSAVDPVFSARLFRCSGGLPQQSFLEYLVPILRSWYALESASHKSCAIAGMFESGAALFSELVWSILDGNDEQKRLEILSSVRSIPLTLLGDDWISRVNGKTEDLRVDFLESVAYVGGPDAAEVARELASDPSSLVKSKAIEVLWFEGSRTRLFEVLGDIDDVLFGDLAVKNHLPRSMSEELEARRDRALRARLHESEDLDERVKLAKLRLELELDGAADEFKAELKELDVSAAATHTVHTINDAVNQIARDDLVWVQDWVTERLVSGAFRGTGWDRYCKIRPVSVPPLIEGMLDTQIEEPPGLKVLTELSESLDQSQIGRCVNALLQAERLLEDTPKPFPQAVRDYYWRVQNMVRAIPITELATVINNQFGDLSEERDLRTIMSLLSLSQAAELFVDQVREEFEETVLRSLQATLRGFKEPIVATNDYDGSLRANYANALARFGTEEDFATILELLATDIERVRIATKLLRRGDKSPQANGARNRCSLVHTTAIAKLSRDRAPEQLLLLLKEPEYERDAARRLYELARSLSEREDPFQQRPKKYSQVLDLRRDGFPFGDEVGRNKYADEVREILDEALSKGDENPGRVKNMAEDLSFYRRTEDVESILSALAVPSAWDTWVVVDTVERLTLAGIEMDAGKLMATLEPIIQKLIDGKEVNSDQDQTFYLRKCISILLFSTEPSVGIDLIQRLSPNKLSSHDLYEVFEIAGYSKSEAVAEFLISQWRDSSFPPSLIRVLVNALEEINAPVGRETMLALLDVGDATSPQLNESGEEISAVASVIAGFAVQDKSVASALGQRCSNEMTRPQRFLMSEVVRILNDSELRVAALNLISQTERNPDFLSDRDDTIFFERERSPENSNWFTRRPKADFVIRRSLFDMVCHDDARRIPAFDLLGSIEERRLQYGKPDLEPRHPHIDSGIQWPPVDLL